MHIQQESRRLMLSERATVAGNSQNALRVSLVPVGAWAERLNPEPQTMRIYAQAVFADCDVDKVFTFWATLTKTLRERPTRFFSIDDDLKRPSALCLRRHRQLLFSFMRTFWDQPGPWEHPAVVAAIESQHGVVTTPRGRTPSRRRRCGGRWRGKRCL